MLCSFERDLADLVEEDGAAIGELEAADPVTQRAGEGALHMAEELALEQVARHRGAVDPDQRAGVALARLVDGARDQLLARADSPVMSTAASVLATSSIWLRMLDGGRAADDAAMAALGADLLLEIGVLELKPLAQAVDLGERGTQLLVGLVAGSDVPEDDDRAGEPAVITDRRRGVLDPEAGAVLAEELLVLDMVDRAIAEGGVDRAFLMRVMAAVRPVMVDRGVHVAADQLTGLPAQHRLCGRIDEGRPALVVDAEDALARRAQDELIAPLDFLEEPLGAPPFGDAAADMVLRLGIEVALAAGVEIGEGQQHCRSPGPADDSAQAFQARWTVISTLGRQRSRPVSSLVQHRLGEDRQRRDLPREQLGDRAIDELLPTAEELAGPLVRRDDAACRRLDGEGRLGAGFEQQLSERLPNHRSLTTKNRDTCHEIS